MKKKILTVLLALTLAFSLLSAAALAAAEPTEFTVDGHAIVVVTTNGQGSAACNDTMEPWALITLTPADGYVFDSCTVTDGSGTERTEGTDYDVLYSGWPLVVVSIDRPIQTNLQINVSFTDAVTVTYDANGGTPGDIWRDTDVFARGQTRDFAIDEDLISPPEGKEYDGVTVNGVRLGPTDSYTFDENAAVVYQWKNPGEDTAPKCTVTFDPNGGTTGPNWEGTLVIGNGNGSAVAVRSDYDILPPAGKAFAGLEVEGVVYAPGESFSVEGRDTLTAKFVWEAKKVTATFNVNGGTKGPDWVDTREFEVGEKNDVPEDLEDFASAPEGKVFNGLEINGIRCAPGSEFTIPDADNGVSIKLLWKSAPDDGGNNGGNGNNGNNGNGDNNGNNGRGNNGNNGNGNNNGGDNGKSGGKEPSPKTGDNTPITLWAAVLAVSAVGATLTLAGRRRREH